jgi:hypothetical protein
MRANFTDEDVVAFSPMEKVGIVAALDDRAEPHLALLSSIMAKGSRELLVGEFSKGLSKEYMRRNKRIGFLVMGLDRRLWRGRAVWKSAATSGEDYAIYNKKPMFRYNTYFGINTVHYLDLVEVEGPTPLPMGDIIRGSLVTAIASPFAAQNAALCATGRGALPVLTPFSRGILDKLDSLTFLSWVGKEGFPTIVPVLQARSSGSGRIVFSASAWKEELLAAPDGARAAIFSMNLGMESVLVAGKLGAVRRRGLARLGLVDLDFAYNSMPPCHGPIFPMAPYSALPQFSAPGSGAAGSASAGKT